MNTRRWLGSLLFGVFVGLTSIMWGYQGITRGILAVLSGVCLMVSMRWFIEDVREKR